MKTKLIAKSKIFKIFEKEVKFNNNKKGKREFIGIFDTLDSVLVAPLTDKKELIFIEEYFQAMNKSEFVFPGGVVDKGETPKQAAVRELGEEAKILARKIKRIGILEVLPKYVYSQTHLFLATDLQTSNQFGHGDEMEEIKIHKFTLKEVETMIKKGQIKDSRTIALCYFLFNLYFD